VLARRVAEFVAERGIVYGPRHHHRAYAHRNESERWRATPYRTLKLLLSSRDYGEVFPRLAGMLMGELGMSIAGIIRARAQALYPATLAVRLYFIACLVPLYRMSRDPFCLVVLGVVVIGAAFTLMSYIADRATRG
jgi:hypothetical protein